MKINILLPYKEKFDKDFPSSVSTTVYNNFTKSIFKNQIKIYGREVPNPLIESNFVGIKKPMFFSSKNIHLAKCMCKHIISNGLEENIIEMHNRPYLFHYIKDKLPSVPICIFFHNNPQEMRGSKTIKERYFLLQNAKLIFCVSNYIKKKFIHGLVNNEINNKVKVLYNGVNRTAKTFPIKKKEILFVGRIVKEKGIELYVNAVENLSKRYPKWKFTIVGSTYLGSYNKDSKFAKIQISKFHKLSSQTHITGFVPPKKVDQIMKKASLIVIPSIWDEPYGLVASEAMANGLAIIASKVGGLPEIINNNGILIEDITVCKLTKIIEKFILDENYLNKYQNLSWDNFEHSAKKSSRLLDNFRRKLMM